MKEFLPGIYQMTLSLPDFSPGSVNIYLLKANDGYVLIDTGWDSPLSVQAMEEQLAEIGAGFTDIKRIIITHCHIDHIGMMVRFKHSHQNTIYLHQKEIALIKIRFTGGDHFLPMTDEFLKTHGVPSEELPPPEVQLPISQDLASTQPDILLQGGEEITAGDYTLRVINTPGHTPGHISLYEPQKKFLFSGDVLLPTITTNAALHVQHLPYPIQQYLKSLSKLKELDIQTVFPGHEYVFSNHRQRIAEIFKNYETKATEIQKAMIDGQSKTAYEVSRILSRSPQTGASNWPNLSGWDRRFAVLQSIAHLESCRFNNEVSRDISNGIYYYRLNRDFSKEP